MNLIWFMLQNVTLALYKTKPYLYDLYQLVVGQVKIFSVGKCLM